MINVNDIFCHGPEAVTTWFCHPDPAADDLTTKQLADISWTRASTLAKSQPFEARKWAMAALKGYEFLVLHAQSAIAESAGENAAALRGWKLLKDDRAV